MSDGAALSWRPWRRELGHVWERGYRATVLVSVRCARCGMAPIEVTTSDLRIAPCTGPVDDDG